MDTGQNGLWRPSRTWLGITLLGWLYFGSLILGIVLLCSLWFVHDDNWRTILSGIGTSFIVVGIVDGVPRLFRWWRWYREVRLAEIFFGPDFARGLGVLVLPEWRHKDHGDTPWIEGVDWRGSFELGGELLRRFGAFPKLRFAKENEHPDGSKSFIAVGLAKSPYADLVCQEQLDKYFTWKSRKPDRGLVACQDNTGSWIDFPGPDPDRNICIIARIRPLAPEAGVWIVCAGADGNGTATACEYLAKHWQQLAKDWRIDMQPDHAGTVAWACISRDLHAAGRDRLLVTHRGSFYVISRES